MPASQQSEKVEHMQKRDQNKPKAHGTEQEVLVKSKGGRNIGILQTINEIIPRIIGHNRAKPQKDHGMDKIHRALSDEPRQNIGKDCHAKVGSFHRVVTGREKHHGDKSEPSRFLGPIHGQSKFPRDNLQKQRSNHCHQKQGCDCDQNFSKIFQFPPPF